MAIIGLGLVLALATAARTSPTIDEQKHIINGLSYQSTGRSLHDETPSARLHSLLISDEDVNISPLEDYRYIDERKVQTKGLWDGEADDALHVLWLARVPTVVIFAVLLAIVALWARALFPPTAARTVLAFTAFSPTLLAHASVASSDLFLTTAAFGACYAMFCDRVARTPKGAAAVGVWVGLALLAKISGVFLYAVIVALFAWRTLRDRDVTRRRRAARLVLVIALPLLVLHVGYGFDGVLQPMNSYELQSQTMRSIAASTLGDIPLPLPANFVQAIDFSVADRYWRNELYKVPAYMAGTTYLGTRLAYFPFAFAVKTSVIILAYFAVALWVTRKQRPAGIVAALGLFPLAFFAINMALNAFDIGVRYVLPVYPFVIMWGGFAMRHGVGQRLAIPAAGALLVSSVLTFPNYIASFNCVSWFVPKHRLLTDSNLDWGQMNHLVAADLVDHPTTAPVHICAFGRVLEIRSQVAYECTTTVHPGRYYVSTTLGSYRLFPARYLERVLVRTLGDVIHVYEVDHEDDIDVTFVNDLEVSAPFVAHARPDVSRPWLRYSGRFTPTRTQFGILDINALHAGVDLANTCVLVRSQHPVVGRLLIGADDTAYVYEGETILAADRTPSPIDWPKLRLTFTKPSRLQLMLCNNTSHFGA